MSRSVVPPSEVEYPSGDGKPRWEEEADARRAAEGRADAAALLAEREAAALREVVDARRAAERRIAELEALLGKTSA